jgi:hypothetical protein
VVVALPDGVEVAVGVDTHLIIAVVVAADNQHNTAQHSTTPHTTKQNNRKAVIYFKIRKDDISTFPIC